MTFFRLIYFLMLPISACVANESVSMIRLISDPDQYSGRDIVFSGYLKIEHENYAVYFDETQAQWVAVENAIWLNLTDKQKMRWKNLSDSFVYVQGTYDGNPSSNFSGFSGQLMRVYRIDIKTRYEELENIEASSLEEAMGFD